MSNRKQEIINAFSNSLYNMKRSVDFYMTAASLTVNTLRRAIDDVIFQYNTAEAIYNNVVAKTGSAANAQAALSEGLFGAPADIGVDLVAIRNAKDALVTAYSALVGSTPATGARAFTFDPVAGLHSEVMVPSATKTALETEFGALQTALVPFTPE